MDKYLLQILLDVNTIIIPGLGALTVTNAKTGEMMFMSYLKYDDGKLAAYISEKESMSENDAKNLIAKHVRDIQAKLDQGQTYDMFQFGRFFKNKDGEIDFESWGTYASLETAENQEDAAEEIVPTETFVPLADEIPAIQEAAEVPEELEVPAPEAITPEEKPEVTAREEEEVRAPEINSGPEFQETAQIDDDPDENEDALDDLTVLPTAPAASLDEILNKQDEKQEIKEEIKPDPIANQTQDQNRVQVENIYIPPSETVEVVAVEEKPVPIQEKVKPEPKPKKKRGAGFWILMVLILLVVGGGITTLLFYEQVKTYLPFLESKRAETEQKKDTSAAVEELNESAAALEAAENERIAKENAPEVTEVEEEPAVAPVEEPVSQPQASTNDGSKNYHVIGGAFGNKDNADRYAAKLKSGGNNSAIVGQFDNLYLVSIDSYASKEEATAALTGFSSITGRAWVFKWP